MKRIFLVAIAITAAMTSITSVQAVSCNTLQNEVDVAQKTLNAAQTAYNDAVLAMNKAASEYSAVEGDLASLIRQLTPQVSCCEFSKDQSCCSEVESRNSQIDAQKTILAAKTTTYGDAKLALKVAQNTLADAQAAYYAATLAARGCDTNACDDLENAVAATRTELDNADAALKAAQTAYNNTQAAYDAALDAFEACQG